MKSALWAREGIHSPCIELQDWWEEEEFGGRRLEESSASFKQTNVTFLTVGNRAAPPIGANAAPEPRVVDKLHCARLARNSTAGGR